MGVFRLGKWAAVFAMVLVPPGAFGQLYIATNGNAAGPGSLAEAIQAANSWAGPMPFTIDILFDGTIRPAAQMAIGLAPANTAGLNLNGGLATIDMSQANGGAGDRAFFIAGGNVSISNLTIAHGRAAGGNGSFGAGVGAAFMKIHPMLDGRRHASASELAVAAMELLSACAMLSGGGTNRAKHLEKITIAERRLSSPIDGPPDLQALAKELSWGYSYFRREFKKQTGLSPWQYNLQARFSLAQRSLMTTNDTLEEIAQSTGFGSAFHLSNAFKKAFGKSPGHWREHQPPEP